LHYVLLASGGEADFVEPKTGVRQV